ELAHGSRAARQADDHRAAALVGERVKGPVELCGIGGRHGPHRSAHLGSCLSVLLLLERAPRSGRRAARRFVDGCRTADPALERSREPGAFRKGATMSEADQRQAASREMSSGDDRRLDFRPGMGMWWEITRSTED